MIKNIDGISKIQNLINNLKYIKNIRTVSNFEHIHPLFTQLSFFSFVKK